MSRLIFIFLLMPLIALQASENTHQDEINNHFEIIKSYLPEAQTLGELQGQPRAAEVYDAKHKIIGYAYYADDVIKIPAYSGKLIHTLVVFDIQGIISGIKIMSHQEPILLVGISDDDLKEFTDQYAGKNISDTIKIDGMTSQGHISIDSISGATITVMVINESVTRSILDVAMSRGLTPQKKAVEEEVQADSMWNSVWRDKVIGISVLMLGIVLIMFVLKRRS